MPKIRILTWQDFDVAMNAMASHLVMARRLWMGRRGVSAIYGVPRGGLPIAVALSHRSGLPVVTALPADLSSTLVVDDVVETGKTFREYVVDRRAPFFWCWVSKNPSIAAPAVLSGSKDEWIVFPWEGPAGAEQDMKDFLSRR